MAWLICLPTPGQRIELLCMDTDPAPIEEGAKGTVEWVTDISALSGGPCWQISVKWDNGRGLMLCVPPDQFRILG